MFKVSGGLSPEIANKIFQFREKKLMNYGNYLSSISLLFIQLLVVQKALNFLD